MKALRLVLASLSVLAVAMAGWLVVEGRRSESWPAVPGEVDSAYVSTFGFTTDGAAGTADTSLTNVLYRYSVNGSTYVGNSISVWDPAFSKWNEAKRIVEHVRNQQPLRVHYKPQAPATAVIITGVPVRSVTEFLFAAVALATISVLLPNFSKWIMQI
jgi:hypothetical protein